MNHCYPRLVRYEVSATVATERVFLQGNPGAPFDEFRAIGVPPAEILF